MTTATIKATLACDIETVWNKVTDRQDTAWRSDIARTEAGSGGVFTEYTKDGFATTFSVTAEEKPNRYAFDLENANMKGRWTGVFTQTSEGTELQFTEEITVKKPIMKLFAGIYLKKQQKQYINDLKKALL